MSASPGHDRFVHALLSPLTALQGAVGLLRRRLAENEDPTVQELLAAIERSTARLRATCELLLRGARVSGEQIQIEVPLGELKQPGMLIQAGAEAPQGDGARAQSLPHAGRLATTSDLVLIVAGAASAARSIGAAMEERGRPVLTVASSTAGLDRARELRPAAVLIDPEVDDQSAMALQILAEDPDTKGVRVALLTARADGAAGGEGSLSIPAELPPGQAAELLERAIAPGASGPDSRRHILVVDDEPDIAALIALQFSDEGYQTTAVHSGTEVLQLVREQQFDLILLDLLLPDLDGFAVLGGLRAQPETQLTPVILVSAINSAAEKVRGLQLGADDYITKPFSGAELSARVQAAMRRSEREGGANPSTRLPGNIAIERAITQRIAQGQPFAICYGDLDNFKAYNDSYGFLKGDAVILRTAQLLMEAVRAHGNPDDFVGHIGGDDFVLITTPDRAAAICEAAIGQFDRTAPLFYDARARADGFISSVDRQGRPTQFPLVSISFAVVSSAWRSFSHPGEVAQRSAEAKKRAKLQPGSVYLIEQ
jgi:DNA-binding response OmpR family regulator